MSASAVAMTPEPALALVRTSASADLVAALSHEVRNTLSTMQVSLEVLADDPRDVARAPELVGHLQRCVAWLEGLIENTRWAAADVDPSALRLRPISVPEATEAAIALVDPLLSQKGQRLNIAYPTPAPDVLGDPQRLAQVVVNLLTNASMYSHRRDVIDLDVSTTGIAVEIRVTDHGPGIPYPEQARIFDRYIRGTAAVESRGRGMGLGLHLAKTLVESHDGTIGVDSVPGQGASFWLRLPVLAVQIDETHDHQARNRRTSEDSIS